MSITALIWSKDRGSQLDTLLESLYLNSNNIFDNISVIYTYSDNLYEQGYRILQDKWKHYSINWIDEKDGGNFKDITMETIYYSSEFICPLVDDDVFYRRLELTGNDIENVLNSFENTVYSLRLGLNITVGDNFTNQPAGLPRYRETISPRGLIWTNLNFHNPFHYPISLDGHLFRRDWFFKNANSIEFTSPNFLEGNLGKYGKEFINIASPLESCVTSIPMNRVQEVFTNKTIGSYSSDCLNTEWLRGHSIDLEDLMRNKCNSTHSNWEYRLI